MIDHCPQLNSTCATLSSTLLHRQLQSSLTLLHPTTSLSATALKFSPYLFPCNSTMHMTNFYSYSCWHSHSTTPRDIASLIIFFACNQISNEYLSRFYMSIISSLHCLLFVFAWYAAVCKFVLRLSIRLVCTWVPAMAGTPGRFVRAYCGAITK